MEEICSQADLQRHTLSLPKYTTPTQTNYCVKVVVVVIHIRKILPLTLYLYYNLAAPFHFYHETTNRKCKCKDQGAATFYTRCGMQQGCMKPSLRLLFSSKPKEGQVLWITGELENSMTLYKKNSSVSSVLFIIPHEQTSVYSRFKPEGYKL